MATCNSRVDRTYFLELSEGEVHAMQAIMRAVSDNAPVPPTAKRAFVLICNAIAQHKELPSCANAEG